MKMLRWEGIWLLTPGGDEEFLEVVQILFCTFPNLLTGCGVQKRISLILFKYSYTSKYLHTLSPFKKNEIEIYYPHHLVPFLFHLAAHFGDIPYQHIQLYLIF